MELYMSSEVQEEYLEDVKTNSSNVVLYLMNGFQLRGKIVGFDDNSVVLDSDGKKQLIFKHAISTIAPFVPGQTARQNTTGYTGYQGR